MRASSPPTAPLSTKAAISSHLSQGASQSFLALWIWHYEQLIHICLPQKALSEQTNLSCWKVKCKSNCGEMAGEVPGSFV